MFEEYRGVNGAVYKVNKDRIARGGEGSIHEIQNMHEYVAKIFKRINVIRNGKRKFAKCRLANFQIKLRNILPGRWMCCMTNMDLPVM